MAKQEKINKPKSLVTMTVHLDLPITSDEAYEYVKNPRGKIAKELRNYLSNVMQTLCKKCLKKQEEIDNGLADD